jgi:hypothetical protein
MGLDQQLNDFGPIQHTKESLPSSKPTNKQQLFQEVPARPQDPLTPINPTNEFIAAPKNSLSSREGLLFRKSFTTMQLKNSDRSAQPTDIPTDIVKLFFKNSDPEKKGVFLQKNVFLVFPEERKAELEMASKLFDEMGIRVWSSKPCWDVSSPDIPGRLWSYGVKSAWYAFLERAKEGAIVVSTDLFSRRICS